MKKNIILKPGRDEAIRRFHPWIFSGAIQRIDAGIKDGDTVSVYSSGGEFLAKGHYQSGSIAVRILTFSDEDINERFFKNRLIDAYSLRKRNRLTGNADTTACRLVHGEGDSLSGLVIDLYGEMAVFQAHSTGMYRSRDMISKALLDVCDTVKCVYNKSSQTLPVTDDGIDNDGWLAGSGQLPVTVFEHSNLFEINPAEGQKTGFFIDQRENRLLLQGYSQGASVLNLFSYTGGFSVYALKGGAERVLSIDSSSKAMALANRNVELNFGKEANHRGIVTDAFNYLKNAKDCYDIIVLDPPAFAKHHSAVKNALQAYKLMNVQAIERLNPGGILFTFSCSQAVSKEQFQQTVFSAAAITGKQISILHHLHQPADHPVNIYHPEGNYLKGLTLYRR